MYLGPGSLNKRKKIKKCNQSSTSKRIEQKRTTTTRLIGISMLGRLEYWKRSIGGLLVLVDTTGLVQPFPDDSFFCLHIFFCGDDDRLLATTLHIRIGVYEVPALLLTT